MTFTVVKLGEVRTATTVTMTDRVIAHVPRSASPAQDEYCNTEETIAKSKKYPGYMQSTAKVTLCVGDDWDECEATAHQQSMVPEHGGGPWESNGFGPGEYGGAGCVEGTPTSVLNNKCKDWSTTLYYRTIGVYAFIYDGTPFNDDSPPTEPEGAVRYCIV